VVVVLAANWKYEGLALLVEVTIAIPVLVRRRVARLWPSYALAMPWLVLRAWHTLGSDIAGSHAAARIAARLQFTPQILGYLATKLYHPWFWIAILVGVMIIKPKRESFVLLVTAIQLLFYIGSYFVTPYDVRWHIGTSW